MLGYPDLRVTGITIISTHLKLKKDPWLLALHLSSVQTSADAVVYIINQLFIEPCMI